MASQGCMVLRGRRSGPRSPHRPRNGGHRSRVLSSLGRPHRGDHGWGRVRDGPSPPEPATPGDPLEHRTSAHKLSVASAPPSSGRRALRRDSPGNGRLGGVAGAGSSGGRMEVRRADRLPRDLVPQGDEQRPVDAAPVRDMPLHPPEPVWLTAPWDLADEDWPEDPESARSSSMPYAASTRPVSTILLHPSPRLDRPTVKEVIRPDLDRLQERGDRVAVRQPGPRRSEFGRGHEWSAPTRARAGGTTARSAPAKQRERTTPRPDSGGATRR